MDNQLDYENNFFIPERAASIPSKLLVGAGPTNPSPRVIQAMTNSGTTPVCPEIYQVMDDVKILLQYLFQTKNEITLALQSSGTGGLEAALCNVVDTGEKIIVAVSGYWGERMISKAKFRNADVVRLESAHGEIFTVQELEKEIVKHKPVALFVTHGESSGGTLQNLEGLGNMCHKYDCLLVVDAVVSLGGVPFYADRWEVDVAVSGSQKAIGAPAGLSVVTMSPRAVEKMLKIKSPPPFYYNIANTCQQWGMLNKKRFYYITYSSHLLCALREALIEIVEEGLTTRWKRHRFNAERFWSGIEELGMTHLIGKVENRLVTVNCVLPPPDIINHDLLKFLHDKYQVISGFGITAASTNGLRFGFMGYNARPEVVDYTLKVLKEGIEYYKSSYRLK